MEETKKYGQHINGQFRKSSRKAEDLFIGRAIRLLGDSVEQYREEKHLQMDTLRFIVTKAEMEGQPDWEYVTVAYEVGSSDPYTEEDRKADRQEQQLKELERKMREAEIGLPAIEESDRQMVYLPEGKSDRIQ